MHFFLDCIKKLFDNTQYDTFYINNNSGQLPTITVEEARCAKKRGQINMINSLIE